jgi:hypothetical protein
MLRSGITYSVFDGMARTAFVREALSERDAKGRNTNLSRIAVRTGLSRKEVSRIKGRLECVSLTEHDNETAEYDSGHAARVLQLWHSDSRFLDVNGKPRALAVSGSEPNFGNLVKAAGGDFPPGAVRAELSSAAAIIEMDDLRLFPVKRHFIPSDAGEDLLVGFTHFVLPVLIGLERNTSQGKPPQFLQRLAYSDRLSPSALDVFRQVGQNAASQFVQSVDDWLSANEIANDAAEGACNSRAAVGVFYFESRLGTEVGDTPLIIDDQISV